MTLWSAGLTISNVVGYIIIAVIILSESKERKRERENLKG